VSVQRDRSRSCLLWTVGILGALALCAVGVAVAWRLMGRETGGQNVTLSIACSPDKADVYQQLVDRFAQGDPRLPNGKRVEIQLTSLDSEQMVEQAESNLYHAISPDSSLWLAEIDRKWAEKTGQEGATLVGDTTRATVSPVVIAMWRDVATSLGYPDKDLGWQDLLRAAESPQFKWSHPSANTASGLLTTLAIFYAGSGVKRDLTAEAATAQATIDYVARLEKTVKYYGEGELAVMEQIAQRGRSYLDAFVVQERMVVQYNRQHDGQLVAIYPVEGTLWADHPLALLENPQRTDEERLAYNLFKEFLLSAESQQFILQQGFRPTDLSIPLDQPDSPIRSEYGADASRPYTTLQIPGPSVVSVVRSAWQYTKRRTNIYLIADVSGSMEGTKLKDAKEALQTFLGQVQSNEERIGLITFASTATEVVPLTPLEQGRQRLQGAIDGLVAGGNTALLDSVDLALIKLQDLGDAERINAIVVMTDGKENRSRVRINTLVDSLQRASESDAPVVVFCIAYGRDADFQVLESISEASGGFTRQGDPETIKNLYKTLSTYF
jgi:Ca-activated chloride channel family protein